MRGVLLVCLVIANAKIARPAVLITQTITSGTITLSDVIPYWSADAELSLITTGGSLSGFSTAGNVGRGFHTIWNSQFDVQSVTFDPSLHLGTGVVDNSGINLTAVIDDRVAQFIGTVFGGDQMGGRLVAEHTFRIDQTSPLRFIVPFEMDLEIEEFDYSMDPGLVGTYIYNGRGYVTINYTRTLNPEWGTINVLFESAEYRFVVPESSTLGLAACGLGLLLFARGRMLSSKHG
jgi:hypothetical protein